MALAAAHMSGTVQLMLPHTVSACLAFVLDMEPKMVAMEHWLVFAVSEVLWKKI